MADSGLISHLGIAVADLDAAVKKYALLTGDNEPQICEVADQKVKVAIFHGQGSSASGGRIELLASTSPGSPISRFLEKKGEGLHHLCIYVKDIRAKLKELKAAGIKLIDDEPRVGAEGNLIAFVHPASLGGVLVELEEKVRS